MEAVEPTMTEAMVAIVEIVRGQEELLHVQSVINLKRPAIHALSVMEPENGKGTMVQSRFMAEPITK